MNDAKQNQHMVDTLFVLILFAFFAICSLMLITLGSGVYQNTVDKMNSNYSSRTSFAYITEKIRQKDVENCLNIDTFGDGSALILKEEIDSEIYHTILYADDGYLKELFCKEGASLAPSAGQQIMPCNKFCISQLEHNLYQVAITTDENETFTCYANIKSSY